MDYNEIYRRMFEQQYSPQPPAYSGQVVQVNGRAGAEAFKMAPNSSVYLQDSSQGNRIFLCMTDGAGYKTIRGIIGTFEEEQERRQQESIILALESRIKTLEDIVNGYVASDEGIQSSGTTGRASKKADGRSSKSTKSSSDA